MKINAELLTIGDEILIGQIVNTNAVWMAKELNYIGISIRQITSLSDDLDHIHQGLEQALKYSDIVIITGGLGPTKDDITKKALSEYFNVGLKKEESVVRFIKESFTKRNIPYLASHESQAYILENSALLFNHFGTAPGMWIETNGKIVISMPGVPFEMKGIMQNSVLPKLKSYYNLPFILHKTIVSIGIPESTLAKMIESVEDGLPDHINLAYLPNYGIVRLRLSGISNQRESLEIEMEKIVQKLLKIIPEINIAATDDLNQAEILGNIFLNNKKTISIAESCTGGYISHLMTSIPDSSKYFIGSVVSYSNQVKVDILGVNQSTISEHGSVSEAVAIEMVRGIKEHFNTDYAISVTGIAGPGGGSIEKPVGLVWIAVMGPEGIKTQKLMANGERFNVMERAAVNALELLRKII